MYGRASSAGQQPKPHLNCESNATVASLAEQQLAADKIPTETLRFVMLGANPSGVPDNLYPTEVYNINGDAWAQPGSLGTTLQDLLLGMELHDAYLGLTPAEIASATTVVEGMTTVYDIPTHQHRAVAGAARGVQRGVIPATQAGVQF